VDDTRFGDEIEAGKSEADAMECTRHVVKMTIIVGRLLERMVDKSSQPIIYWDPNNMLIS